MRRTATTLADGRELIYYDERTDATRDLVDRRELPPPPEAAELRYDALLDEWVAVATHRQNRTFLPPADECPLCPSTSARSGEIPATDYDVVVFENRFPSFSARHSGPYGPAGPAGPTGSPEPPRSDLPAGSPLPVPGIAGAADGTGDPIGHGAPYPVTRPGGGRCEVVCFTADHQASFAALSPARVRTVLDVLAERTRVLGALPGVEQVFCFENRGVEIGVTLHHPHGQIYAYPFVTPRTRAMLAAAGRYAGRTGGRNLYGDLLATERAEGTRVVATNGHWTAFVPAAARWPFEVHVAPRRAVPDLPELTDAERDAFGPLYLDVLRRFDGLFDGPMPYISAWHQAPVRTGREVSHLHLQLFSVRRAAGKLKYLAGSESAMGVFINDIRPEQAAELLRRAG